MIMADRVTGIAQGGNMLLGIAGSWLNDSECETNPVFHYMTSWLV
jgi:hypothetical protein